MEWVGASGVCLIEQRPFLAAPVWRGTACAVPPKDAAVVVLRRHRACQYLPSQLDAS
jgi:hypothetical protein